MNNFIYQNPTKLVFGKGQIARLPELIPADRRIMITFGGGSVKRNGVYDEILSAEGEQYPYFRVAGVTCSSDSNGVLALEYGGAPTAWWYRSPYPVSFEGEQGTYFYQVMDTGYPSSLGSVGQGAGVTVGLCL